MKTIKLFYLLLTCVGASAMSTRLAYFEALRKNCTTMECMRRVGVCHSFVFKNLAFSAKYHPLAAKCSATYTDPALVDFCAHVAVGDYKANGTMRTEVLKSHVEKYFCNEYNLLGDILARFQVCDSGLQAEMYLDCILEGCVST
ncbi:uncharacterized protein LOC125047418 [Penaeus chinensis]|uniref:uncharacterized protein LOC125047418 n=1 Tax=Penaeus chinensis TaxID=139456 RepID=UPI001FB7AF63|nr:uncharacterized protein LOC125047418 [Penaeus chinensis]